MFIHLLLLPASTPYRPISRVVAGACRRRIDGLLGDLTIGQHTMRAHVY
jgi:hypothetical protein